MKILVVLGLCHSLLITASRQSRLTGPAERGGLIETREMNTHGRHLIDVRGLDHLEPKHPRSLQPWPSIEMMMKLGRGDSSAAA